MTPQGPFSRVIPLSAISAGGVSRRLEASAAECAEVAAELGLVELRNFVAEVSLSRTGDLVSLDGRLAAESVQNCVLTLVPVVQAIDEAFSRRLLRRPVAPPGPAVVDVAVDEDDPPDTFSGDRIDLGAIAVEQLALVIDPYPRAPGARFALPDDGDDDEDESPFAVLTMRRSRPT